MHQDDGTGLGEGQPMKYEGATRLVRDSQIWVQIFGLAVIDLKTQMFSLPIGNNRLG